MSYRVKCTNPRCKKESEYHPKNPKAKRKRHVCPFCSKRFEINKRSIISKIPYPSQSKTITSSWSPKKIPDPSFSGDLNKVISHVLNLDNIDKLLIFYCENKAISQKTLAEKVRIHLNKKNFSRNSVQKRIEKLIKSNILVKIKGNPNSYKLNKQITQLQPNEKLIISTHNFRIKADVIGNYLEYNLLRNTCKKTSQMNNWAKKYFNENNVNFILNTKSLEFNVTGAGLSVGESLKNAKMKALQIWDHLQKKHNIKLQFPKFLSEIGKVKPHYVLIKGKNKDFEDLKKMWTDYSHPALWETDDKLLADKIQDTLSNQDKIDSKLEKIENQVKQINTIQPNQNLDQKLKDMEKHMKALVNNQQITNQAIINLNTQVSNLTQAINNLISKNPIEGKRNNDNGSGLFT